MQTISSEQSVFAMSRDNQPVVRVASGDDIVLQTMDCFSNQITSTESDFAALDWAQINPATGPIFVEGAAPGDVLCVEIKSVTLARDYAVMVTGPDLGVLGDEMLEPKISIVPVEENHAILPGGVRWPIHPMIGVIGVAPEGEAVPCGTPGPHGGNMDCKVIKEGSTVWLPVNVDGALFALGDLHAAMGDGEVAVCGLEIPGQVTVNLSVVKGVSLPTPMVTDSTMIYTLASALTFDEAAQRATHNMAHFMVEHGTISLADATSILSIAGDVQVCQLVDPEKTCRVALPRTAAEQLDIMFDA